MAADRCSCEHSRLPASGPVGSSVSNGRDATFRCVRRDLTTRKTQPSAAKSLVMHGAARHYDLLAWLLTLGREPALRERLMDIARVAPSEAVLDVGCGTGSLALAAKRRVGPEGAVHAVDASPEMVGQAAAKAAKAGLDVTGAAPSARRG